MAYILIADDDDSLAKLLAEYLKEKGHETEVVFDGSSAVDSARRRRPDLMIMDINMPALKGPEAFKSLDEDFTRETPVIFISGLPPEQASKLTFLPLWSRGLLLRKPIDLLKVGAAVAELLGRRA